MQNFAPINSRSATSIRHSRVFSFHKLDNIFGGNYEISSIQLYFSVIISTDTVSEPLSMFLVTLLKEFDQKLLRYFPASTFISDFSRLYAYFILKMLSPLRLLGTLRLFRTLE